MGDNNNEMMFVFLLTLVMLVFALSPGSMGLNVLADNLTHPDATPMQVAFDRGRP